MRVIFKTAFISALWITSFYPQGGFAQTVEDYPQAETVLSHPSIQLISLSPALENGVVRGVTFIDPEGLKRFYESREYAPIWFDRRGVDKKRVEAVNDILANGWTHGFNPARYQLGIIKELMDEEDEASLFALELILSDAVIRYVRDLSTIRVDKYFVTQSILDMQGNFLTPDILGYISGQNDLGKALSVFEPKGRIYQEMRAALVDLIKGHGGSKGRIEPVRLSGTLRPGNQDAGVEGLRIRLLGEGAVEPVGNPAFYDPALVEAVKRFQADNGLAVDGIVGSNTLAIINKGDEEKIDQILVNLERLRWIAHDKPERYILVNIPTAKLWAIEDGQIVLDMPVILGRDKRETEMFITKVTGVRFNPTWTLPPTIMKEDFLPKLRQDAYYATNRGIEFYDSYGPNARTLDPGQFDWANMSWNQFKGFRMVQGPGPTNPLGRVRILMPNPYNIYIHDTSTPGDFNKSNRFLSSGCIRASQPEALTHFIMKDEPGWTSARYDELLGQGKTKDVGIENAIPVYILYQTIWLNQDNSLVYGRDIYGLDEKIAAYIREKGLFAVPTFVDDHKENNNFFDLKNPAVINFNP